MDPQSPARRPLAPTSINAILASPVRPRTKSPTPHASLKLPPISLNPAINGKQHTYALPPQSLPSLNDAISSALRKPLPASGSKPQSQPMNDVRIPKPQPQLRVLSTNPPPSVATARPPLPPLKAILPALSPKRKADDISTSSSIGATVGHSDVADDCDVVRRKVYALINSGNMTVAEFLQEINCNQIAYARFMSQNGPDKGSRSEVYAKAWSFLREREVHGNKPSVKKSRKDGKNNRDVSSIKLDGEDTTSVPIYDSCDEVRRKIREHLALPSVTQAGFLRDIGRSYPIEGGKKIQSKVLNDFLAKRGKYIGNTTAVYYGSYVFFEKMRIRDGEEKSRHRIRMEKEWADEGGIDTKHRENGKAYYSKGS